MWEQDTAGKDSGFGANWPTPTVSHADRGNHDEPIENYQQRVRDYEEGRAKGKPGKSLGVAVRMRPTPTVNGNHNRRGVWKKSGDGLATAVKMMPTPNTMDHLPPRSPEAMKKMYEGHRKGRTAPSNLREWVNPKMWPTPAQRDYKGQNSLESMKKKLENGGRPHQGQLPNAVAMKGDVGALCCEWVEWLMGWPVGWTDLEPLSELVWHSWHTEPDIPRVKREKVPKRPARLKALGNGQVPLACAVAWEILDNS